jgi:hypothetical protein
VLLIRIQKDLKLFAGSGSGVGSGKNNSGSGEPEPGMKKKPNFFD